MDVIKTTNVTAPLTKERMTTTISGQAGIIIRLESEGQRRNNSDYLFEEIGQRRTTIDDNVTIVTIDEVRIA